MITSITNTSPNENKTIQKIIKTFMVNLSLISAFYENECNLLPNRQNFIFLLQLC